MTKVKKGILHTVKLNDVEYGLLCEVQRIVGRYGTEKASAILGIEMSDEEKFTKARAIALAMKYLLKTLEDNYYRGSP